MKNAVKWYFRSIPHFFSAETLVAGKEDVFEAIKTNPYVVAIRVTIVCAPEQRPLDVIEYCASFV